MLLEQTLSVRIIVVGKLRELHLKQKRKNSAETGFFRLGETETINIFFIILNDSLQFSGLSAVLLKSFCIKLGSSVDEVLRGVEISGFAKFNLVKLWFQVAGIQIRIFKLF